MKLYIINEEIYIAAESYGKAEEVFKVNTGKNNINSIRLLASEKDGGKYLIIEKHIST